MNKNHISEGNMCAIRPQDSLQARLQAEGGAGMALLSHTNQII
jgi:hypothetical protein